MAEIKHSRERRVQERCWVPSFILDETWTYIRLHRSKILSECKARGGKTGESALWPGRWGSKLTEAGARAAFNAALEAAGITDGVFHDCRHTYAITTLDRLMLKSSDPKAKLRNPLEALKKLLGHKHLSSTAIYLQAREQYLEDLTDDDIEAPDSV